MLRSLVLALLIVNLGFFAWIQGWLRAWMGLPADAQREPQRLSAQLNTEAIEVIRPGESARHHALRGRFAPAASASTPAAADAASEAASAAPPASQVTGLDPASAATGICVEAGPFNQEDAASVDKLLRPLLPNGSWSRQSIPISGQWMVYMGPYANDELYERKAAELKRIKNLSADEVRNGPYARGFSLGRFTSEADAETRLSSLRQRGIRTARVVTIRPEGQVHYLRAPQASVAMQVTLSGLKLPQGKSFTACRS
jgi:hypothetical protein